VVRGLSRDFIADFKSLRICNSKSGVDWALYGVKEEWKVLTGRMSMRDDEARAEGRSIVDTVV
jgi:hypothetical protein